MRPNFNAISNKGTRLDQSVYSNHFELVSILILSCNCQLPLSLPILDNLHIFFFLLILKCRDFFYLCNSTVGAASSAPPATSFGASPCLLRRLMLLFWRLSRCLFRRPLRGARKYTGSISTYIGSIL